jgi:hypothetical protein
MAGSAIEKIHRQLVEFHTNYSETKGQPPLYICLLSSQTSDKQLGQRRTAKRTSGQKEHIPIGERLQLFFDSLHDEMRRTIKSAYICLSWETTRKGDPDRPSMYVRPQDCKGEYFFAYRWNTRARTLHPISSAGAAGKALHIETELRPDKIKCFPGLYEVLARCNLVQPYVLNDATKEGQRHKKIYEVEFLRDLLPLRGTKTKRRETLEGILGPRLRSDPGHGTFYQFTIFGYELESKAGVRAFVSSEAKDSSADGYYTDLGRWLQMAFILFVLQWNTSLVTSNAEVLRERDDRIPYLPPGERANMDAVLRPYYEY